MLNEGGGTVIPFDDTPVYGVCVAEKGVFRFTLTTSGSAGHASMPGVGDNALLKMAPLLEALAKRRPGSTSPTRPARCSPRSTSTGTATPRRASSASASATRAWPSSSSRCSA